MISLTEFKNAYLSCQNRLAYHGEKIDLDLIFDRCDLDNDGFLDWHEFLLAACDKRKLITDRNLQEVFYCFDHW